MIEFRDPDDLDVVRWFLQFGQKNAMTQRRLAEASGLPLRAVQSCLEALKRGGEPICTGDAGVWLSDSADELRTMYRRDRSRALRQLQNNRGRLKAIDNLLRYRQTTLPWEQAG